MLKGLAGYVQRDGGGAAPRARLLFWPFRTIAPLSQVDLQGQMWYPDTTPGESYYRDASIRSIPPAQKAQQGSIPSRAFRLTRPGASSPLVWGDERRKSASSVLGNCQNRRAVPYHGAQVCGQMPASLSRARARPHGRKTPSLAADYRPQVSGQATAGRTFD
jgi:hypothetical protein